jgi:hypothetical protein
MLAIGALISSKRMPSVNAQRALFELEGLTNTERYAPRVIALEEWVWGLLGSSVKNAAVRLNVHRIRRLLCGFHHRIDETMELAPQAELLAELFRAIREGDRLKAYALAETGLNARNRFYLELLSQPEESPAAGADPPSEGAPAMDG